jgi:hypothetical protein
VVTVGEMATDPPAMLTAPVQLGSAGLDEARQLEALVLVQVRLPLPPTPIVVGLAPIVAVTGPVTVTVTELGALVAPPAPAQVIA